jgi:hypothetical protein
VRTLAYVLAFLFASAAAHAAGPPTNPRAYALIVGSNAGGAGQEALRFAETDARRVRTVLTEIGGYGPANVTLLLHPNVAQVEGALSDLRERFEFDHERGQDSTLFFYYSGHARARAMNLGDEMFELAALRARLTALPTALTIVVLDACQSGAFERTKGAAPAADFSFNSVQSLNTRGLAVLASSSSAELSQESDRLHSAYFTHYLVTALRGAGDQNTDGRVSLDEAYRYAYSETLTATSRTRVGGQHVTLETDLTGQGDVPVTFPAEGSSQLVLPGGFRGQVLLRTAAHHAIIAELTKAPGSPLMLALAPGSYEATVRQDSKAWDCKLALPDGAPATLDLGGCTLVADELTRAKGGPVPGMAADTGPDTEPQSPRLKQELWSFEGAVGWGGFKSDAYVDQIRQFGYDGGGKSLDWAIGAAHTVVRPLALLARFRGLDSQAFSRPSGNGNSREFDWSVYGLSVGARGTWEATNWLGLYGQVELGPALGFSRMTDTNSSPPVNEGDTHAGFFGNLTAGLQLNASRDLGFFYECGYLYAPVVENLIGSTHDSGGVNMLFGLRIRLWGKR